MTSNKTKVIISVLFCMITYYSNIYTMDVPPKLKDEKGQSYTHPPEIHDTESLFNRPIHYSDMPPPPIVPSLDVIENSLHEYVRNGDKEGVKRLISQGVFPNAVDVKGWTALHVAAKFDKPELVELLIAQGIDINVKEDTLHSTPLHIASEYGFIWIVNLLLNERRVLLDAQDKNGNTPLHVASSRAIAESLLQCGASLTIENKNGLAPFFTAAKAGNIDVVRYLLAGKVSLDQRKFIEIHHATGNSHIPGPMPLHRVASYGATKEVVELLIDQGAKIEARGGFEGPRFKKERVPYGQFSDTRGILPYSHVIEGSPLHYAAFEGHKEVVEVLLDRDAKIEAKDEHDLTPLHLATNNNHKEIAEILVRHGANIRAKDSNKNTPLIYANKRGWAKSLKQFAKEAEEVKKQLVKEVKEAKKQPKRK